MEINLPPYDIKLREKDGHRQIFDFLRRRYVALTPEEWVRQHFVHFLIGHKGYPKGLLANEVELRIGEKKLRPFFHEDGTYDMRNTIKLGLTIDERIADGYYYSKTMKLVKYLLANPELLELPAGEEVDYLPANDKRFALDREKVKA